VSKVPKEEITNDNVDYDDLTVIKGIGDVTQQWLRDALGVYTYSDLALLSVKEIEARSKADRKIVSRSKIESWVADAQALSDSTTFVDQPEDIESPDKSLWYTVATFVVEFEKQEGGEEDLFRTKAHHMEADVTKMWSNIEWSKLGQWIFGQLNLTALRELPVDSQQSEITSLLDQDMSFSPHVETEEYSPSTTQGEPEPAQPMRQSQQMPTHTPPLAVDPSQHSSKLQHYIVQADRLATEELSPSTTQGEPEPAQPMQQSQQMPTHTPPLAVDPSQHSSKLQHHIAKAMSLADRDKMAGLD
jgi:ribosomal protein L32